MAVLQTDPTMMQELIRKMCLFMIELLFHPDIKALSPSSNNPTSIQYSCFVLSIFTCVLGLVGNTIVIIITGFLMKTNKSRIWFLNLAIADLMFLLILPLNAVSILKANWPYGQHVCKMYNFLSIANMHASIFLITALTVDRFLSVMAPIWHHKFYSPRVCFCACASIWAVTVLSSIPAIVYSQVTEAEGQSICSLYDFDINKFALFGGLTNNLTGGLKELEDIHEFMGTEEIEQACFIDNFEDIDDIYDIFQELVNSLLNSTKNFLIPLLIIGYFIPLCVIVCCNVSIACKVRTFETIRSSKLFCIISAAILVFFITRTPLVISQFILLVCLQNMEFTLITRVVLVSPLLSSIANLNCCLNPIIYVFFGREVISVFMDFIRRIRYRSTNSSSSVPVTKSRVSSC
uniref:G-protein coupled receptors family 1 profile domain-containing protein n=1 Tax=Leptobrachium leishanense TaxID=445787 RepID=A0A8C5W6Q2_9ANUR